jgi:hypothetical protein
MDKNTHQFCPKRSLAQCLPIEQGFFKASFQDLLIFQTLSFALDNQI